MRHHFTVGIQVHQKCTRVGVSQCLCDPGQIVVAGRQHMGLLVVQVLDAVLHLSQKHISSAQGICCGLRHEPRFGDALQSIQRGAGAQFRELPATHHLQKLHREFDLSNATTRQLHIVGAFGMARAAFGRMVTDLLVQRAQRLEHVVVEVAAEHKGQHHRTQRLGRAIGHRTAGRDHAAFHPGKALPLAALHQQILFQRTERHHAGARIAVGTQSQVHTEHKAVLGGVANQGVHALDGAGEVLLARHLVAAFAVAQALAVFVVHVNQVDVARHIQLLGTELAHADDPHLGALAVRFGGCAMQTIQIGHDLLPSDVERHFGQPSHAVGHHLQTRLATAIQLDQALQSELAQHTQSRAGVQTCGLQREKCRFQALAGGRAGGQQRQDIGITAVQTLQKPRIHRQIVKTDLICNGGLFHRLAAGHNSC